MFSTTPPGWYSSTTRIRVNSGWPRAWKVTVPSTVPLSPSDFQTMRLSGICSVIVELQLRCDKNTCAFQFSLASSSWLTVSTFFMKVGKSWNCVQTL